MGCCRSFFISPASSKWLVDWAPACAGVTGLWHLVAGVIVLLVLAALVKYVFFR